MVRPATLSELVVGPLDFRRFILPHLRYDPRYNGLGSSRVGVRNLEVTDFLSSEEKPRVHWSRGSGRWCYNDRLLDNHTSIGASGELVVNEMNSLAHGERVFRGERRGAEECEDEKVGGKQE